MRFLATCGLLLALVSVAGATDPASFSDALAQARISLNARLRYEEVEQAGLRDTTALTLRTRVGFIPAAYHGWLFLLEAENIIAADGDSYSQAGLNPGGAGRAVIADPEISELNQAWLACTQDKTTVTLGRQRLVLDNARFVGDVGWRQNMQTFDALVVQDKSFAQATVTYAYFEQINRVFSRRHVQGRWDSDSHVFNANYTGLPAGTLTAYAYLLDFKKVAAANSCATYGASFAGMQKLSDRLKLAYRAEFATQTDYGSGTLNYAARYYAFEAGLVFKDGSLSLGHEVLGSGSNVGFKTPLATLHACNGWADLFLATPAAGLRDNYAKITATLPEGFALLAFYHRFDADAGGAELGHEFDLQLTRKFGKQFTGLIKFADFRRQSPAYPNVQKIWAQVEFAY